VYLLDALRDPPSASGLPIEGAEFRLVCSGVLYRGNVVTADWTKSGICRLLLRDRMVLLVVSEPADAYPQELMLRFAIPAVSEPPSQGATSPRVTVTRHPHAEVAADFAAVLTLLLRRLIVVHSHVRVERRDVPLETYGVRDWPLPIFQPKKPTVWRPRPPAFVTEADGTTWVKTYDAPPVAVDTHWLERVLAVLPLLHVRDARAILACARLYGQGMQLIEERPDVAYQLFIAAAEALAQHALEGYSPGDDEKARRKPAVQKRAREFGLSQAEARELAILATEGMSWSYNRFEQFLTQYTDDRIWLKDDLFVTLEPFFPRRSDLGRVLSQIYGARGALLHTGSSYPATVGVGTSNQIPVTALPTILAGEHPLPPVTWFERVVQHAAVSYITSQLPPVAGAMDPREGI
jgi:hypothetical protein